MKVETRAKLRYLRTSPRKTRLVVDLIRGLKAEQAIAQLLVSKKNVAKPVLKLLKSAMANAQHNDHVDPSTLVVKTAFVDGGPILYRWMPRAHGRASKIKKRTSHITIILEGDAKEAAPKKVKQEKKETEEQVSEPVAEKKETKKKAPAKKKQAAKKVEEKK